MDGHPAPRRADVLPREALARADRLGIAVEQDAAIAQAPPEARVVGEGPRRAVDVELGVAPGGAAGLAGDVDELVAVLVDGGGQPLEPPRPLGEGGRPQRRPAHLPRVRERFGQIEAFRRCARDRLVVDRVDEGPALARSRDPLPSQVAPQRLHVCPSERLAGVTRRAPVCRSGGALRGAIGWDVRLSAADPRSARVRPAVPTRAEASGVTSGRWWSSKS